MIAARHLRKIEHHFPGHRFVWREDQGLVEWAGPLPKPTAESIEALPDLPPAPALYRHPDFPAIALRLEPEAVAAYVQLASAAHLRFDTDPIGLLDAAGVIHPLTVGQLRQILRGYSFAAEAAEYARRAPAPVVAATAPVEGP